jgi:hypothetical protein
LQNALLDLLGGMDPGEHDVVHDIQPGTNNTSVFGGSLGLDDFSSLSFSGGTTTSSSTTNAMGGGSLASDLLDLLGGGGGSSNEIHVEDLSLQSTGPQAPSSTFPSITNMPLFSTVQPSALNGISSQQHELIPGQFFNASFFSLGKQEQLTMLRERAEQDGIMSGINRITICVIK